MGEGNGREIKSIATRRKEPTTSHRLTCPVSLCHASRTYGHNRSPARVRACVEQHKPAQRNAVSWRLDERLSWGVSRSLPPASHLSKASNAEHLAEGGEPGGGAAGQHTG